MNTKTAPAEHSQPQDNESRNTTIVSRRDVLLGMAALSGTTLLDAPMMRAMSLEAATVTVTVGSAAGATIPSDYTGLSYETSQLTHPAFFAKEALVLERYFRLLGKDGVLRIGGNMSEFTFWNTKSTGEGSPTDVEGPDPGKGSDRTFQIPPVAIDHLAAFLERTGWKLIYGLNLRAGSAEIAADEAEYVSRKVGSKLIALQFGNEPDLFKEASDASKHWTYNEFIAKWQTFYDTVHSRVPHVPIAGPDTSFQPVWMKRFAEEEKGKFQLLTGHYYAGGPPTDPKMTTEFLLEPNTRLVDHVLRAIEIAKANDVPYRMSEGNTCYGAGKKGVSDTFASALWVLDFWLALAQQGSVGVNLHGGGNGYYTPIAGSPQAGFVARPIFYGMMLAGQFAGAQLLPCTSESGGKNVVGYAARKSKEVLVAVINRGSIASTVEITPPVGAGKASVWRLEAPAVDSTSGVTLAGASVDADGKWSPAKIETLRISAGKGSLALPAYSAALVRFSI
ncbi:glycosyl hydrolase family 79 C-terminal domain-containing protein [Terriglobus roseus]|uniref:Glycosyl hydrolase family 79, N-terminal domain n=1 Tax=Terriglobus roseus TaxID=392734 RepID=A0A1H4JVC4_9BACT|nr:glycosyl hydrolase family 79 C-terminal domain-containing protein [Terriglobus roseus]SEB50153.1 Glycosyl hydrolase family 79, N-terminal domain [Terriglobus roseus]